MTNGMGAAGAPEGRRFVLVTAHFTVVDEIEPGRLSHVFIQDAKFNVVFGGDGRLVSKNSWAVAQMLKGLHARGDRHVVLSAPLLRRRGYLCADPQGAFSRRIAVSEWETFRLVPLEAALDAKSRQLPLDVVVTAAERGGVPGTESAPGLPPEPLSVQPPAARIPRIIHQTYSTRTVPDALQDSVQRLRNLNPAWLYQYWSDEDIVDFINEAFGWGILRAYLSVNPQYGAARADLFRYLCIYHYGGVYLDIKSSARVPFREIIRDEDEYLLSFWDNQPGGRYGGFGFHAELSHSPRGELQQWHVIAAPGHPLLQRVIEKVLSNIRTYNPHLHGCGKRAVLRTTGPVAYTEAIHPHISEGRCRMIESHQVGIEYNRLPDHHGVLGGPRHYSQLTTPLVI